MVSNRRRRCMLICLGLVMEIRIVVVVTAVLACFVQVRESSRRMSVFSSELLEEEQGLWLKIVNQHSVLHCMYRCFAAFASCLRMCVGCNFLSWNRETASHVRLKCRQNSGTLGVMSCLGEGEKDLLANEKKTSSLQTNWLDTQSKQHD